MDFKVMPKTSTQEWINRLVGTHRVIAPKFSNDRTAFEEVCSDEEVHLAYKTTILPPKKALLPQSEDLFQFDRQTETIQPVLDRRSTVILGVHSCDLWAIKLLDQVFCSGYFDQHYFSRRQNTTLIGIECLEPCSENAFCRDMDTLSITEGFDLHFTDLRDVYGIQIGSSKGAGLLSGFDGVNDPSDKDRQRFYQVMKNKWSRFPYHLEADISELPSILRAGEKSALWQELERQCLGCGMCTIVCPTCYCFDILDDVDFSLDVGKRFRRWDSCQINQFATVAGGHDFRAGSLKRQQHRFLRKYRYQSAAPGLLGCVGCGRCANACLVDINPVDVLNRLYRSQQPSSQKEKEVSFQ